MPAINIDKETTGQKMLVDVSLCPDSLYLHLQACTLRVRSNSAALLSRLRNYFNHLCGAPCHADMEVIAIESPVPQINVEFIDWKREPGKTGRKDSYYDLPHGRLIRKVRTGMLFLQSTSLRIAMGPCLANDNQVINFINAQYMNWLQHRNWLICHASGLVCHDRALAIAGFSGGGKSTLMLNLLDHDEISYLTNDRLFIKHSEAITQASGIPKLPRINPGTIVHNPRLHSLIPAAQRAEFLAMPIDQLWHLEQKYDVYIDSLYGEHRIVQSAPLHALLILNWSLTASESLQVQQIELRQRPELLPAIMKSPGPFYQTLDGTFLNGTAALDALPYLEALTGVRVYEATGMVDFAALSDFCHTNVLNF